MAMLAYRIYLIYNMQSSRVVIFLIIGLCASQSLQDNPLSDIVNKLKDLVNKADEVANKFEKDAWKAIGELRDKIGNLPKCVEAERGNVTELLNQSEQEAMQCITQAMSDAQPQAEKLSQIVQELIPLVKTMVPELMDCERDHGSNPITMPICVMRVMTPLFGQITKVVNDIKEEIPVLRDLIQNEIIPLMEQCSVKLQGQAGHVRDIIAELEKCIQNS